MNIKVELLDRAELANFISERFPAYLNFGPNAAAFSWDPYALADELLQWLRGETRVHGQKSEDA